MSDLPKQIDRRVRRELAALTRPWRLVKKRDHYFVQIEGRALICVGSNASKQKQHSVNMTLDTLRKL